jgi:hypothetical protein
VGGGVMAKVYMWITGFSDVHDYDFDDVDCDLFIGTRKEVIAHLKRNLDKSEETTLIRGKDHDTKKNVMLQLDGTDSMFFWALKVRNAPQAIRDFIGPFVSSSDREFLDELLV